MWGSRKPKLLMKGTLADRPWAATLNAIAVASHSGQLTLKSDGKVYQIAFANGVVVGATSPCPADTVQRIGLTNLGLPAASIAAAVRILGRGDDVDKFTEAAGLVNNAAVDFKQRVLVQRVARTFTCERGDFVLEDRITIPVLQRVVVDVRAAIYQGMRMHLPEVRLASDLRQLGSRFILYPEAAPHLEKFDLGAEAELILSELRGVTSVAELEALHRELDPRLVLAVLGALATCNVILPIEARVPTAQDISLQRAPTPRSPTISRVPTPRQPTTSSSVPVVVRQEAPTNKYPQLATGSRPRISRTTTAEFDGDQTVARPEAMSVAQVKQLIASRVAMLEGGVDFFSFLGIPYGAPPEHVRAAYLEIARYLRPERLAELRIRDERDEARTVFAQALIAMTTLTDERRRADYMAAVHGRGARA